MNKQDLIKKFNCSGNCKDCFYVIKMFPRGLNCGRKTEQEVKNE